MKTNDLIRWIMGIVSLLGLALCLYVEEELIDVIKMGVCCIYMLIVYAYMLIIEVLENGNKDKNQ